VRNKLLKMSSEKLNIKYNHIDNLDDIDKEFFIKNINEKYISTSEIRKENKKN
jgi:hypothetical protein